LPPAHFQGVAPYAIGIVEFGEAVRLPGMIKNVKFENMSIGMKLQTDFETTVPNDWPQWPRYFFREP